MSTLWAQKALAFKYLLYSEKIRQVFWFKHNQQYQSVTSWSPGRLSRNGTQRVSTESKRGFWDIALLGSLTKVQRSLSRISARAIWGVKENYRTRRARVYQTWSSHIVCSCLICNENGEYLRFFVGFRALNQLIFRSSYPFPITDELLDTFCEGKYYTKIDLLCFYH